MFDIGWSELLVILVVMLIVVGPKDLPRIVRTFGQWTGKARSYARDFQRTIEEAAEETEMSAIRKEIELANKEIAEAQKSVVNVDTSIKLDDGAGAGTTAAANTEAQPPKPDPAASAVAQAVQAGESAASSAKSG
ncbi:MAG: Sec-independent protein translocase protein TatB [Alphaproteobacteria bacterium]